MAVISGRMGSVLNPEAAPYVPGAYRAVEDFSAEWWELVQFSPWFRDYWLRDYWLRECFHEPQNDPDSFDIYDLALPDDIDSLFYPPHQEEREEKEREEKRDDDKMKWEVMTWGAEKWKLRRGSWGEAKYAEKAPKIVNVKVSPRTIQQPR